MSISWNLIDALVFMIVSIGLGFILGSTLMYYLISTKRVSIEKLDKFFFEDIEEEPLSNEEKA